MDIAVLIFIISIILESNGISLKKQLEHVNQRHRENLGLPYSHPTISRRQYDIHHVGTIIGAPSDPNHLPQAEPILPGHTLIRPALGMLKSALKFPHRDPDNGAGVYGNVKSLGIRYDGRNERVLYSGFRRTPDDYIMVVPAKRQLRKPVYNFVVSSVVLDKEKNKRSERYIKKVLREITKIWKPNQKDAVEGNEEQLIDDKNYNKKSFQDFNKNKLVNVKKNTPWTRYQTENSNKLNSALKRSVFSRHGVDINKIRLSKIIQNHNEYKESQEESEPSSENNEVKDQNKKLQWLLSSRDAFNHIKINQHAPNHHDFLPVVFNNDDIQTWWYYNQKAEETEKYFQSRLKSVIKLNEHETKDYLDPIKTSEEHKFLFEDDRKFKRTRRSSEIECMWDIIKGHAKTARTKVESFVAKLKKAKNCVFNHFCVTKKD